MIDICEESSYQFTVHYLITHIIHQTLLQLLQVKEKLPWKFTKVRLEAQPKWYHVEHLSQETMSSNRFGKSHSALHSFLMEWLSLVFFKFNVTFDLTGFIFGNGENCLSSMHFRRWLRMTLVSKMNAIFFPFQPLKQNSVINAMAKTPLLTELVCCWTLWILTGTMSVFSINPWHLNLHRCCNAFTVHTIKQVACASIRVTNRSHSTYGSSAWSDLHRVVFCPNSVVSGWKN